MRKDDGVDGDAQRIGQLTWMLFLKVLDQREEEWEELELNYNRQYQKNVVGATGQLIFRDKTEKNKPQIEAG
jgi:type I restriction enzyme M protein